ncbi:pyridoxamine kinase [Clostridium weizhouense]|uniref:pyridoxal kinase n=1 Tax=Clostridium weizhouense TaxID=2859781 RepID=A0ABS7APJ6_9CLOT|nr:pyridoxamine kinase [Clostridium weizhouense]MBW6410587.1 pyridoxamine kinase [Clostridium weizhouense]
MKKPIKRVAAIHDICGFGKAALTNIIPVLSTLGVEVCPIPTMVLSTHTGGFGDPKIVKLKGYVADTFEHYKEFNIDFEGIFVGYLGTIDNIKETYEFIKGANKDTTLVCFDPIFGDYGNYYSNFNENYSEQLKKLLKYSDIITPNFTEACILADEKISEYVSEEQLLNISRKLFDFGCKNIIITSVPVKDKNKIATSIYLGRNDSINIIISNKLKKSYPGTGDIFTSVLIGKYLNGISLLDSVKDSCEFVERCIRESSKHDYDTKEGVLLESSLKYLNDLK